MNEIDNYKYIFFKSLYTILGLSDIEKEISNQKIFPLEIVENDEYDVISNYFFLLNEININEARIKNKAVVRVRGLWERRVS